MEKNNFNLILVSVMLTTALAGWIYWEGSRTPEFQIAEKRNSAGVIIPVRWSDLGIKMVEAGVIDLEKFEGIYGGGLDPEVKKMLTQNFEGEIVMTEESAPQILNVLWALGLGNKNEILEDEMMNPEYDTSRFASTGGWTLAAGNPMNHYNMHNLMVLDPEMQKMADEMSRGIYRPCCGNSTHFPDCNHGMAMLGLLELMSSQGVGKAKMYEVALEVNALWFPDQYQNILGYFEQTGKPMNPAVMLGEDFSSSSGYREMLTRMTPVESKNKSSCGV